METDIIQEIRAFREAFAAAHGYDIKAIAETLRKHQAEGGREVVSFGPRPAVQIEVDQPILIVTKEPTPAPV